MLICRTPAVSQTDPWVGEGYHGLLMDRPSSHYMTDDMQMTRSRKQGINMLHEEETVLADNRQVIRE